MIDLYEELYLSRSLDLNEIQRILTKQRNDWTPRSVAMPNETARMLALIDNADAVFASDESRADYDAVLALFERVRGAEKECREEEAERARIAALKKPFEDAEFRVLHLDEANRRTLVITRDCIARMPYHQPGGDITWERCTLRRWLNNEFYDSLPQHIRSRVIEVVNQNPANPDYGTPGGNATRDRVFLLSIDEARRYFSDDADRSAKYQGSHLLWWLRSPGRSAGDAAGVRVVGVVGARGLLVGLGLGVRSALWLNL